MMNSYATAVVCLHHCSHLTYTLNNLGKISSNHEEVFGRHLVFLCAAFSQALCKLRTLKGIGSSLYSAVYSVDIRIKTDLVSEARVRTVCVVPEPGILGVIVPGVTFSI